MKWIDLRVQREDGARAVQAIINYAHTSVGVIQIDPAPPASGPEIEVSFPLLPHATSFTSDHQFRRRLEELGIPVLASRVRTWERR